MQEFDHRQLYFNRGMEELSGLFEFVEEDRDGLVWRHNGLLLRSDLRFLVDAFKCGVVHGGRAVEGTFYLVGSKLQVELPDTA